MATEKKKELPVNRYAVIWRIQSAKNNEVREKRIRTILEMPDREEKFHP